MILWATDIGLKSGQCIAIKTNMLLSQGMQVLASIMHILPAVETDCRSADLCEQKWTIWVNSSQERTHR